MKVALLTIVVWINGIRSLALLDTGCSRSLIRRPLCHSWKMKELNVLGVAEKNLWRSGVGLVQFDMTNKRPISFEILVVDDKLLGFDLLLKKLGGLSVTSEETVSLP